MSAIQLDHKRFHRRIRYLASKWKVHEENMEKKILIETNLFNRTTQKPFKMWMPSHSLLVTMIMRIHTGSLLRFK